MNVWWKDRLPPSVVHSSLCGPSKPYPEGRQHLLALELYPAHKNPLLIYQLALCWHRCLIPTLFCTSVAVCVKKGCSSINTTQCLEGWNAHLCCVTFNSKVQTRKGSGLEPNQSSNYRGYWNLHLESLFVHCLFFKKDVCNYLKCI